MEKFYDALKCSLVKTEPCGGQIFSPLLLVIYFPLPLLIISVCAGELGGHASHHQKGRWSEGSTAAPAYSSYHQKRDKGRYREINSIELTRERGESE